MRLVFLTELAMVFRVSIPVHFFPMKKLCKDILDSANVSTSSICKKVVTYRIEPWVGFSGRSTSISWFIVAAGRHTQDDD